MDAMIHGLFSWAKLLVAFPLLAARIAPSNTMRAGPRVLFMAEQDYLVYIYIMFPPPTSFPFVDMEIEPKTLHIVGKLYTAELHPQTSHIFYVNSSTKYTPISLTSHSLCSKLLQ